MLTKYGQELVVTDTLTLIDLVHTAITNGELREAKRLLLASQRGLKKIQKDAKLKKFEWNPGTPVVEATAKKKVTKKVTKKSK